MNMGGTPSVGMIEPWISAGLDCEEAIVAFFIGYTPPRTDKVGIQRRIVLVHRMVITSRRVRLPDLDEGIRNRPLIFVHHLANDDDALAHRLFAGIRVTGEIDFFRIQSDTAEQRSGDLRQCLLDRDKPLEWPPFYRRTIGFEHIRWMRLPIARIVFRDFHNAASSFICLRSPIPYKPAWL